MPRRRVILAFAAAGLVMAVTGCSSEFLTPPADSPSASPSVTPEPSASAAPEPPASPTPAPSTPPEPAFDTGLYSVDDPASPWVVANKLRPISPAGYAPADLVAVPVPFISNPLMRPAAAEALVQMFAAGAAEGAGTMQIQNAYRSYDTQVRTYGSWVARVGQAAADAQSARPGHSEHQTGFALDITGVPEVCSIQACFGDTPQGVWLAANAWRFGYVLRYPEGKTDTTGFIFEPWHFRYVGPELSAEMHATGIQTLEEFFGLPPAPGYP